MTLTCPSCKEDVWLENPRYEIDHKCDSCGKWSYVKCDETPEGPTEYLELCLE